MINLTGRSIGRYHILEPLGEGGMAVVYKAFDTQHEREVAIKFIRGEKMGGENAEVTVKRFKREARLLAKLSHPNILTLLDYGEYEGHLFLVTNYLPGGSLKARLGKSMSWPEAAHLLIPIARAIEYAHSRNIMHRDIKPSNILLSTSGAPVLADFGIAKVLEGQRPKDSAATDSDLAQLTRTDVGIGTPEYMAPEQGRGRADQRSDVYSLGVVFYEMVTGRKPFIADTPLAVLLMHVTDPLPAPRQFAPNLPPEVERIIIKALEKSPANRYQTMTAFAEAISQKAASDETRLRTLALELEKAEKWEEASKAWRDILEFGPADREVIAANLDRIQQMRELTGLYLEARQAMTKNDYDRAIRLLKEIMSRTGTYKDASFLLTQAVKTRQSRTVSLEKEEKWDEVLKAWRDYVALEPENRQFAEAEIARIEQVRDLAKSYQEARQAINKKDYALATKLLKDIVARDETYRDVLQLLTNVAAKRSAVQQQARQRRIWIAVGVIFAVALISVGIGYGIANWTSPAKPTPVPTAAPEKTSQPPTPAAIKETATPISTDTIRAFADPILTGIANKTPDYQDDFSDPNSGWPTDPNSSGNEFGYQNGAYLISNWRAKRTDGQSCTSVDLPVSRMFSDFVLEMDGIFLNSGEGSGTILFRMNESAHYGANISPMGKVWFHKNVNGVHIPLPQTNALILSVQPEDIVAHLTLIARQDQMAIYVNGEPVTMLTDTSSNQGTINIGVCDGNPLQVLIDNLKVWDISGISLETSADKIHAFTDPILAAIANKAPDYQDDFSDPKSGWLSESTPNGGQWGYVDGTYSLKITPLYRNPAGDPCMDVSPGAPPQFPDFVLEVETEFITEAAGSLHLFIRDMPPTPPRSLDISYFLGMSTDGNFFFHKNFNTDQVNQVNMVDIPASPLLLSGTGKNRWTVIAQGSQTAVYANGKPLVIVNDASWENGNGMLIIGACNESPDSVLEARFDNLKVWNIAGLSP